MNKKEAIEIIKKNWPDSRYTMLREALQTLIPELKESVDERIKRWLDFPRYHALTGSTIVSMTTSKGCIENNYNLYWEEKE